MNEQSRHRSAEVVVVGGGPAGLTAAVALARAGVETVLTGPLAAPDHRTTALLAGSVTALETLGVWDRCRTNAAPLRTMRIVDDTGRLWRAPEVCFAASDIGLDAFGHNIENRHLTAALEQRAGELAQLTRIADTADAIVLGEDGVTVRLAGSGTVTARLVVGADGARSLCRTSANIDVVHRQYRQCALTFNAEHSRDHGETSTEFHTDRGPFTVVPLPGRRSAIVWVLDPEQAEKVGALEEQALNAAVERRAHSIVGRMKAEPGRGRFPLVLGIAARMTGTRTALVGEAAHQIPPIGAQGLNLGLRDAAAIAEFVVAARRSGKDCGGSAVLSRYDAARRADVASRTTAVDWLNRSLLTDLLPVQGLRGLGLYLVERIAPLRRAVLREGTMPAFAEPRLMRGELP